jgi:peptidyl-prolyl cis-trans isomerase SurA
LRAALAAGLALCVFFVLAKAAAAASRVQINCVAAVVNGEMISLYDLQRRSMQEFMRLGLTGGDYYSERQRRDVMRTTLDSMVLDMLLRQEAERYQVVVEERELDNEIRMLAQSNRLTREELELRLVGEGSSLEELRGKLRDNMLRQRMISLMISRKAEVSPEEIESYYREHIREFSSPGGVYLSMILPGPGLDVQALSREIAAGEFSFAEAAKKYSTAPNAAAGGSLGFIPLADLNASWRAAVEELQEGEISAPLSSGAGALLLRVDGVLAGSVRPLDEVAEDIASGLRETRLLERFEEYSAQLRSRAMVEIRI